VDLFTIYDTDFTAKNKLMERSEKILHAKIFLEAFMPPFHQLHKNLFELKLPSTSNFRAILSFS